MKNSESVKVNAKKQLRTKQSTKDLQITEDRTIKGMYKISTTAPSSSKHVQQKPKLPLKPG